MKNPAIALFVCLATGAFAQTVPNIKDSRFCPNTPTGRPAVSTNTGTNLDMARVVLDAPGAVCNDGTPAVIYVRSARPGASEPDGSSANRWVIHFEGGGGCNTFEDCLERWCGLGFYTAHQMSSTWEAGSISRGGLLNRNAINRLGDRNLVMLNYCSSDGWRGRRSDAVLRSATDSTKAVSVHFRGATIVEAAFDALERGVAGLPKLTDATDVLISGDSAGASGVRHHLDRLAARLKAKNSSVRVRGNLEATFLPDFNGKQGFPAGDSRDPVFAQKSAKYNTVDVGLLNSQLDDSCLAAHPGASSFLCADNGYVELNHMTTPFFQIQDLNDPGMLEDLEEGGLAATPAAIAQGLHDQITALGNIRNTAVDRTSINSTPGTVARLCGVHVTWGDDDGFLGRKIRSGPGAQAYSYYELLWNWMTGASPSNVLEPKPPTTPDQPVLDSICDAKAPTAPPGAALNVASSASYAFGSPVAPEMLVAAFGTDLARSTALATTVPWPTTLGGTQVTVTDSRGTARLAPLYYVSATQLAFLIPAGTANGTARVAVGSQQGTVTVEAAAPGIYTANQTGRGVAAAAYTRVTARGARTDDFIFSPTTGADSGVPVAAGDQVYLILYGTGMRGSEATATVGGVGVPVAGPVGHPLYPGVDQINLGPLPLRIGYGQKQIVIRQGERVSNTVTVTFKAP
ncbi:MAG: pectin acetylesterase-family hydrolase [Bryobacteraceae bacterium]